MKTDKSSRPDVLQQSFCKRGVLRNFVKFTGKHLVYEILRPHFFYRTPLMAAFEQKKTKK